MNDQSVEDASRPSLQRSHTAPAADSSPPLPTSPPPVHRGLPRVLRKYAYAPRPLDDDVTRRVTSRDRAGQRIEEELAEDLKRDAELRLVASPRIKPIKPITPKRCRKWALTTSRREIKSLVHVTIFNELFMRNICKCFTKIHVIFH